MSRIELWERPDRFCSIFDQLLAQCIVICQVLVRQIRFDMLTSDFKPVPFFTNDQRAAWG